MSAWQGPVDSRDTRRPTDDDGRRVPFGTVEYAGLQQALPAYEIGEVLGRGGCGVVVAGRHRQLGREVAIKRLPPGAGTDPELRARFLSEARLLAALDHPHIVPVYDFVEADGLHLLIMERLTGGTVMDRARTQAMNHQAACAVVVATCAALDHAHARGVLHRDIKPENLMFSGNGVLKVTDFGIAKLLGDSTSMTRPGALFGTPRYMAPEQIAGGELGPATDVYSVGIVLYELLAGDVPFPDAGEAAAALYQRVHEEPVPLLDRAPGAPPTLAEITARALARDPTDRYPTARELSVAVRDAAAREWGPAWETASGVLLRELPASAAAFQRTPPRARSMTLRPPRAARSARDERGGPLLEREGELAAIEAALDDANAGDGALVVITAAAGMGKTRLTREIVRGAQEREMLTLTGRGIELEREFPFGVVRQLFEPALMAFDPHGRDKVLAGAAGLAAPLFLGGGEVTSPIAEAAVDHALYWLVANLATTTRLALVVDDAHWADRPSLRALLHLVVRLEDLPVAVVVAARPAEPLANQDVLDRLANDPLTRNVRPSPLSEAAVATLLRTRLSDADDEFSHSCHAASAGNPFLVAELTAALAASGITPTAQNAARVRAIGPETVVRSVQLRLNSLPPEMGSLARSVAILSDRVPLAHAARTAGLERDEAGRAADALAAVDILAPGRPLDFAHPLVRAAVYESMSASERSAGHLAAARMLHGDGAAAETVAAHLLHSEPAGDEWVVERMREAATAAAGVGALATTVVYYQRALEEPPPAGQRAALLIGLSEGHRGNDAWEPMMSALGEAIERTDDAAVKVEAARRLCAALLISRRHEEAAKRLEALAAELRSKGQPELALDLELSLSSAMWLDTDRAPRYAARVRSLSTPGMGANPMERVILSRQAWAALVAGESAETAAARARASLASGELIAEDARAVGFEMSVMTLALTGHFAEAHEHLRVAMDAARTRGYLGRLGFLSAEAAQVFLLEGRLAEAEQHGLQALDRLRPDGMGFPAALDALIDALLERGQPAAAWHVGEHLADRAALPDPMLYAGLRLTRPRLLNATGEPRAALADVLAIGRRQLALERPNPAWCPWRSTAALLHLQLGEQEPARTLADEELALARTFGARRPLGVALRAAGMCRGGKTGLKLLREAALVLEDSGADLELARALADLGAALRRAGERGEPARTPLRRGRELAQRLGAQPLASRAHDELLAAGARPRRAALRGVDALTPSERRVCELAAQGMSNRQIAQALFVTVKTVEGHLAASYAKLGITRKHELADALAAGA